MKGGWRVRNENIEVKDGIGCEYCNDDKALFYTDGKNNALKDSSGDMLVTVKIHLIRFKVTYYRA